MKGVQKKKVYSFLFIVMLIVVLFSIAFTYSKYSGLNIINSSAKIASWNFNVSTDGTNTKSIDLASTYDKNTLVNGKIAPGTKGQFNICLDGTGSDVGISYIVEFVNEKNHPDNLIFKYADLETNKIEDLESKLNGEFLADSSEKIRNITIEWEWPYETDNDNGVLANDYLDTEAGVNANDYILDVSVTAKQVLPK